MPTPTPPRRGDERARPLRGRTIAITEARRSEELSTLIEKLGGVPRAVPSLREVPVRDRVPAIAALEQICAGTVAVVVFFTGVGTRALLELAAERGRDDALRRALATALVVARGPKPVRVLREHGLRIDVVPAAPTSAGLVEALGAHDLRGRVVAVQLAGEEPRTLLEALRDAGATVLPIALYEWAMPEDDGDMHGLVEDLIAGKIDVIAFTSSPQIAHLAAVAERHGRGAALTAALASRTIVAVVGPVCAATARAHGVTPRIEAPVGTMGALIHGIAAYLEGEARSAVRP
ncbi:MAG TPA: uroporphyrinogen-III synthase [Methylomirabilota bacterium]